MPPPSAEVLIEAIKRELEKPEPNKQFVALWLNALEKLHGISLGEFKKGCGCNCP